MDEKEEFSFPTLTSWQIFKFSFFRLQLETYGRKKNADKYCIDLASIEKDNNKRFYIRLRDYGITDDNAKN